MRALAVLLVLAYAAPALAQANGTQTYRVKQKDTLDVIAAEFYGDRKHAIFIMVENKMQHRRALRPGERLRIPVTREITTEKGDTFEALAQTYLGDARRAPFLADFNELTVSDTPATGTVLTVPFHVTHVAQGTESLNQISMSYFGDGKQADMLLRYNNLEKPTLEKGASIAVPILHIRVRSTKLPQADSASKGRRKQQRDAAVAAAGALPSARTAWLQGDFAGVKATLVPLADKLDFLDTESAVEIGLLLGKAYVAFADTASAAAIFTQVIDRKPAHMLTRYAESPKVIDAWKQAGGQLQGE